MTLIEIVAGLVILGTILASLAIARGRFARQWAAADRKLAATKAVDEMIAGWMESTPPRVPLNREGVLPGVAKHVWRTRVLRDAGAQKVLADIVRVEAYEVGAADRAVMPVVAVDLLVHRAPRRAGSGVGTGAEPAIQSEGR